MSKNKLTKHHIIPKSRGWKPELFGENIKKLSDKEHKFLHQLFGNRLPIEQIDFILDFPTNKKIKNSKKEDLQKIFLWEENTLKDNNIDLYLQHLISDRELFIKSIIVGNVGSHKKVQKYFMIIFCNFFINIYSRREKSFRYLQ